MPLHLPSELVSLLASECAALLTSLRRLTKKLTISWCMPQQQLAQELEVFERGLHAEIIYQEIWKVQGARKVRTH